MQLLPYKLNISPWHHMAIATIIVTLLVPGDISAQDPDQMLLNQLYREIVTSSGSGGAASSDTSISTTLPDETVVIDESVKSIGNDQANILLQREIEKIVKDIKIRHTEAVKFMQDK